MFIYQSCFSGSESDNHLGIEYTISKYHIKFLMLMIIKYDLIIKLIIRWIDFLDKFVNLINLLSVHVY
jgi:hypothetical protein